MLSKDNEIYIASFRDPDYSLEGIAFLDKRGGGHASEFRQPGDLVAEKCNRFTALYLYQAPRLVVVDCVHQQEFRSARHRDESAASECPIGARRQIGADQEAP